MRDDGAGMDKWECSEGGRKDAGRWQGGGMTAAKDEKGDF